MFRQSLGVVLSSLGAPTGGAVSEGAQRVRLRGSRYARDFLDLDAPFHQCAHW